MYPAAERRLLYFLLVALLINACCWTFNRDAVADVFFAEQKTAAAAGRLASQRLAHFHSEPLKAEVPCNHWCHAVGHFLALFSQMPVLFTEAITGYYPQISSFIPEPAPEDLFRPPRLLS